MITIPKENRKTILLLSDDMRLPTGVGVMSKEIVEKTCGHFNWIQVGAALTHPQVGKRVDASEEIAKITGVEDASVILYPQNGYGNAALIRQLFSMHKIDAVLHFTDPRYWVWLYQMEHEIRRNIPLIYYNIWDNLPLPMYNKNFYLSSDALFAISKQTYNINKHVLGEDRGNRLLKYVPHGVDSKKFFPVQEEAEEATKLEDMKRELFKGVPIEFTVLYNSRNMRRKQTSDVLLAYNHFISQLTSEEAEGCRLLLHTAPVEDAGTDLLSILKDIVPKVKAIFSPQKVDASVLNLLYNIADVTVSLSSNEGFGLSTCESLVAGTPILVNVTGGPQDQCGFMKDDGSYLDPDTDFSAEWGSNHDARYTKHGEWAFPIWPVSISLQGSPATPYIFDDRCSWREAGDKLLEIYRLGREERKRRGLMGREFALGDGKFDSIIMADSFVEGIEESIKQWTPRERYTLLKV